MLFMLRISIETMAFAVLIPSLWVAIAVLGLDVVLSYRKRKTSLGVPDDQRWMKCAIELVSLTFAPLLILALGLYLWPESGRPAHETLGLTTIDALGVLEVALAGWLVWRHRRRLGFSAPVAIVAVWWTGGTIFTSSMAITNTWL